MRKLLGNLLRLICGVSILNYVLIEIRFDSQQAFNSILQALGIVPHNSYHRYHRCLNQVAGLPTSDLRLIIWSHAMITRKTFRVKS